MTASTQHSSYWLDKDLFTTDLVNTDKEAVDMHRIARLAAVRRAVANFVSILSGKNVPVQFSSGKQSYTDGEAVVISAEENSEKFDSMVGLALHEGSHILLSDFTFLRAVMNVISDIETHRTPATWLLNSQGFQSKSYHSKVLLPTLLLPESIQAILPPIPAVPHVNSPWSDWDIFWASPYWTHVRTVFHHLKDIMNILEDRRIDKYVYQNAQGYRPYYDALYTKYFFTAEIGKNLRFNPDWREITIENYINRLLFAFHPDATPDAMPGLPELLKMLDLPTIDRVAPLKFEVYMQGPPAFDECPILWQDACNILGRILQYTTLAQKQNTAPQPQPNSLEELLKNLAGENELPNLDADRMEPIPVEQDVKGKGAKTQAIPGKFNQKKAQKELDAAKNIMDGKLKKKSMKKAEQDAVEALDKANADMVDIGCDVVPKGTRCMVLRKVTKQLLEQDWFMFGRTWKNPNIGNAIAAGRRMGALLHNRLQVRNDPILTKQTRLPNGGLDRRLLAQLGMDITSVFQKSRVDSHKPVILHLSLDASGSMSGKKWEQVVTVSTAIAYVASKMKNVDAVISLRGGNDIPIVAVLFDSRKDQFTTFLELIRDIGPAGATPEGLAFKATLDLVLENAKTHDVYFINFSDGEPGFSFKNRNANTYVNYRGETAIKHTKTQMRTMRDSGVKILSYFIHDGFMNGGLKRTFTAMYGDDSVFVNVQNATEVLRTLNKLLLNRGT